MTETSWDGYVHVRGAAENNLAAVDVDIPRGAFVAFTGVSGSGKSSLAFGTLYAEAQRRYFESVAPYARRLLQQVGAPHVAEITGLPPAVALQQRRGAPSARSSVGTITTLSNLLRMLYSRAGTYPEGAPRLEAESFSPNTAAGACPRCGGLGTVHDVTEELMVPDPSLSIHDGAIAATIAAVDTVDLAPDGWTVLPGSLEDDYVASVAALADPASTARDLRIVLTPLHGVGGRTALSVLATAGPLRDEVRAGLHAQGRTVRTATTGLPGALLLAREHAARMASDPRR